MNHPVILAAVIGTLSLVSVNAVVAAERDADFENHCHQPGAWDGLDQLLRGAPSDPLVIRAYALRIGICQLIDQRKISVADGTIVYDIEKQRLLMERLQQETRRLKPTPIDPDELEPLSRR